MKQNTQNRTYITIRIHKHNQIIHNKQHLTEAYKTYNRIYNYKKIKNDKKMQNAKCR